MSTETRVAPAVAEAPAAAPKRSAVEGIKEASRQLRGTIALELARDTDHFPEADKQLLKFHGTYQQEDRDARKARKKDGVGKHHMFMVRCKIPGGRMTADQYLALDALADAHGNGTLRFTARQGVQFHGVLKTHLKDTIAGINACLLSTLGACGDVERNVMACPAPCCDGLHEQLQETAALIATHLAPRSRAYHEIWLNGKPLLDDADARTDLEPIYGKAYLPRKFKTGLTLPGDNCIDVYAQDLGLLAVVEGGRIVGYNMLVGGSMGMTHGNPNTFPQVGKPICFVPAKSVLGAAEAVVKLFRDHGNRADRKRARIKYVVHDWGVEKFRTVLEEYVGGKLALPRPVEVGDFDLHLGWHPQGDGNFWYGVSVENGRVKDEGGFRLRSALRGLVERFRPGVRLTPMQDILLCGLDESALPVIEKTLADHGILRPEQVSTVRKHSIACPAIPTCGLAISESERTLPGIIDELEAELKRLSLENERIGVRMTGCPNGCARPYQSEIGIVGRSGDKYTLYVGGHLLGHRLNFPLKDLVPRAEIVPTLRPVLEQFQKARQPGETFGDFCHRLGAEALQALLPGDEVKPHGKPSHAAPAANGDHAPKGTNGTNGHGPKSRQGDKETRRQGEESGASVSLSPGLLVSLSSRGDGAALSQPETVTVALRLPEPAVAPPRPATARLRSETFLAGLPGEELPDYAYRYHSDGSVRDTVVYYYDDDRRAAQAGTGAALRREAVYLGKADPTRLHAARKLSDTRFVGAAGQERRDIRLDYLADGRVAQTVVFHYEGDQRAADAPSGAAVRRQTVYEGALP